MSAQIVAGIGMGSMLSSGALLVGRLSGSDVAAGLATTSTTLGAALLGIPLAALSSAYGRRVGLGVGWLIAAVGSLVVLLGAWLGWYPVVLLGTLLIGSGTASNLQSRYAAADLAEDSNRARSLSLVVWSTTAGSVIGPNLSGPGEPVARALSLPEESGTFVFSVGAFVIGWSLIWFLLRPDPLRLAATAAAAVTAPGAVTAPAAVAASDAGPFRSRMASALRQVRSSPSAQLGLASLVLGHAVMASVMTMTPVHLSRNGEGLTFVGITISVHIAGMYALSPLVGWLSDRVGRGRVIVAGQSVYVAAALVAGLAGSARWAILTGLFLLGLGWSCATVAGSTLLTESVAARHRSQVQGLSDTLMNLVGAAGGALSGGIVAVIGFGGLNAAMAAFILPVAALALRSLVRVRTA